MLNKNLTHQLCVSLMHLIGVIEESSDDPVLMLPESEPSAPWFSYREASVLCKMGRSCGLRHCSILVQF